MIVGLIHPHNGRKYPLDGPLDDFDNVMPVGVIRDIVRRANDDKWHSGGNVTVTSALGCPRRLVMERFMPLYVDVMKMWAVTAGSWLHTTLGKLMEDEGWVSEEVDSDGCTFQGELFGIPVGCRVDARRLDYGAILDWKTSLNGATKWIKYDEGMPRWDDKDGHVIAQMNMCRLLMGQATGVDVERCEMRVWGVSESLVLRRAPVWNVGQIGAVHPGGAKHTVLDAFRAVKAAFDEVASGVDASEVASRMPLYGLDMWKSRDGKSSCSSFCACKWECDALSGGI